MLDAIAAMATDDREMVERVHAISRPPRRITPAPVVRAAGVHEGRQGRGLFRAAAVDQERYLTCGVSNRAKLDRGRRI